MSWTDAAVVLLALATLINSITLIWLHRRTAWTETQVRVLHVRLRTLKRDMNTLWVSPDHQLPHIKHLDIRR